MCIRDRVPLGSIGQLLARILGHLSAGLFAAELLAELGGAGRAHLNACLLYTSASRSSEASEGTLRTSNLTPLALRASRVLTSSSPIATALVTTTLLFENPQDLLKACLLYTSEPLFFFPDMPSSDLPGPAGPALRVSGSHIHPYMCG